MLISDNTDNSVVDKFISDNIKKNNDDFTMDLTKFDPLIYRIKNHNIGRQ